MPERCGRTFEESVLSGYVDQALPQQDAQHVRIHLEDCPTCRVVVAEMQSMREVTMSSSFKSAEDLQWSERPKSAASRISFGLGWLLIGIWCAGIAIRGGWALWHAPWPTLAEVAVFGGVFGLALLFLGVLLDRLTASRTDRYKGVQR
jgi:anti-sigma factor RsiW